MWSQSLCLASPVARWTWENFTGGPKNLKFHAQIAIVQLDASVRKHDINCDGAPRAGAFELDCHVEAWRQIWALQAMGFWKGIVCSILCTMADLSCLAHLDLTCDIGLMDPHDVDDVEPFRLLKQFLISGLSCAVLFCKIADGVSLKSFRLALKSIHWQMGCSKVKCKWLTPISLAMTGSPVKGRCRTGSRDPDQNSTFRCVALCL